MATTLSHRTTDAAGPSMSVLLGAAVFLVAVVLALFVVLPALSRGMTNGTNSSVPSQSSGQMDVNVNPGQ